MRKKITKKMNRIKKIGSPDCLTTKLYKGMIETLLELHYKEAISELIKRGIQKRKKALLKQKKNI